MNDQPNNNNQSSGSDQLQKNCLMQNAWKNASQIIGSENTLVHHRMTAFLTLQGLLFASFSLPIKGIIEDKIDNPDFIYGFLCLLSLIGFMSALLFHDFIRRAHKHINATKIWFYFYWHNAKPDRKAPGNKYPTFPSLTGGGNFDIEFDLDYAWYSDKEKYTGDYMEKLRTELEDWDKKHLFSLKKGTVKIPTWGSLGVVRLLAASWFAIFIGLIVLGLTQEIPFLKSLFSGFSKINSSLGLGKYFWPAI